MRKLCLLFALGITGATFASAQLVSVGALGGVRPTDIYSFEDESRWYEVGGSVEIRLPAGFAIEADGLYQRIGESNSFAGVILGSNLVTLPGPSLYISRQRGNSWEFPLYMKYYFRPRSSTWQPFMGSGFAFRTVSLHSDAFGSNYPYLANGTYHFDYRSPLDVGASIAAGVRFHAGPVALLPQVRYTRWSSSTDQINANEVTLLLGVSF